MNRGMSLIAAAVFAGICALIVNLIILYFARPLAPGLMPLSLVPVCMWTILGTIGASITYALLRRWGRHPNRTYVIVAIVVLLLSFTPDYLILHTTNPAFKAATPAGAAMLMLMHVVVAAFTVIFFLRAKQPEGPNLRVKSMAS